MNDKQSVSPILVIKIVGQLGHYMLMVKKSPKITKMPHTFSFVELVDVIGNSSLNSVGDYKFFKNGFISTLMLNQRFGSSFSLKQTFLRHKINRFVVAHFKKMLEPFSAIVLA